MQSSITPTVRYSTAARWFHWLAFTAVALAYLFINLRGVFARGSAASKVPMQGHILFGLVVLVLVLPRLLHRLRNTPPPVVPPLAPWEALLSGLTHWALYAFLLVQPLLGLFTVWAGGALKVPFTALQIPSPLTADRALHEQLGSLHTTIGTVFYYVIGLHIAGALWHHFFRRDNTLRRML
ncbi:MAG: cytochrome [Xanthomonadaceae bacterium]|nr:cytochrome [Xanthomonadaceae bacterium]